MEAGEREMGKGGLGQKRQEKEEYDMERSEGSECGRKSEDGHGCDGRDLG